MSISKIQFSIIIIILMSIGYSFGFQCGKYYGSNGELKKELNKLYKKSKDK